MMTTTEYRSQFGRPLPKGNDGNILHATNHFTNHDQRSRSYETGGNILAVPHTMFSG